LHLFQLSRSVQLLIDTLTLRCVKWEHTIIFHLKARSHAEKGLSEKLPPLRQSCLEFESKAQELSARRKSTSLVLARHTRSVIR
jgi:hypothetical protein